MAFAALLLCVLFIFGFNWCSNYYGTAQNGAFVLLIPFVLDSEVIISFIIQCILPSFILAAAAVVFYRFACGIQITLFKSKSKGSMKITGLKSSNFMLFTIFFAFQTVVAGSQAVGSLSFLNNHNGGYLSVSAVRNLSFPSLSFRKIIFCSILCFLLLKLAELILSFWFKVKKSTESSLAISKIGYPLAVFFTFIACLLQLAAQWVFNTFGTLSADQFLFQIRVPLKGTNSDFYFSFALQCLLPALYFTAILALCVFPFLKEIPNYTLMLEPSGKKRISIAASRQHTNIIFVFTPIIAAFVFVFGFANEIGLVQYIKGSTTNSSFFENNYVDPRNTTLTFPEKKRNLIYIFMESMENTYMSRPLGGTQQRNLIPELTQIAKENISFSNTNKYGGAISVTGTSWTIAAMVSQHTGIPFNVPFESNSYDQYESFMPGAYSLGDILNQQGYNQTLIVGSDAEFGGRKAFYSQHGDCKVLDLYTAWDEGIVANGRTVFWGFEDSKLYEYAKLELGRLSSQQEPFNLTMLTVDTHHVGGYRCSLCGDEFPDQYWNVIQCASRQLQSFLTWLEVQEFYENTTIVVVGDHRSMDAIVSLNAGSNYQRTPYNAFINSTAQTTNNHNRLFTPMDLFPTTLASMGVTIEGDRLALGTNLFSELPTLLETYGVETLNSGISGQSKLYKSFLHGTHTDQNGSTS